MQNNFNENLSKICKCVSKPAAELTDLGIASLTNGIRQVREMEHCMKKPDQFIPAQLELGRQMMASAMEYSREASRIIMDSMTDTGKVMTEIFQNSGMHAAGMGFGSGREKTAESSGPAGKK